MRQFIEQKSNELNWYFEKFYYQDFYYRVSARDLTEYDLFHSYDSFGKDLKKLLEDGMDNVISEAFGGDTQYYLITTPEDEYFLVLPHKVEYKEKAIRVSEKLNRVLKTHGFESICVQYREVRYDREWEYRGCYELRLMYPYYKFFFELKSVDED